MLVREAAILQKVKDTVERGRQLQGRKKEQVSHGWPNKCEMYDSFIFFHYCNP